jgi:hypothetical protein
MVPPQPPTAQSTPLHHHPNTNQPTPPPKTHHHQAVYTALREAEYRSTAPIAYWNLPPARWLVPRQRRVTEALKVRVLGRGRGRGRLPVVCCARVCVAACLFRVLAGCGTLLLTSYHQTLIHRSTPPLPSPPPIKTQIVNATLDQLIAKAKALVDEEDKDWEEEFLSEVGGCGRAWCWVLGVLRVSVGVAGVCGCHGCWVCGVWGVGVGVCQGEGRVSRTAAAGR